VKDLIQSIRKYTDVEIFLTINGNYNKPISETYRKDILDLCASNANVYPIFFSEMRGLSKLWNTLIIHTNKEYMLLLNDDLEITDKLFFTHLESALNQGYDMCKLQTEWYASFSHFFIKKTFVVNKIGFFDERLLGFGEEDGDITYRYIELHGTEVPTYGVPGIIHKHSDVRHENVKPGVGKYSFYNRNFMFNEKYKLGEGPITGMFGTPAIPLSPVLNQYPYEGYFEINKVNL
jgi:hypothetical protein